LNLRESCLLEMGTGSLGGGRRPARKRASSDPTVAARRSWREVFLWKTRGMKKEGKEERKA
jgi:hypothetical protein